MMHHESRAIIFCAALAAITACRAGSAATPAQEANEAVSAAAQSQPASRQGLDRCSLLTDGEVEAAIGPHRPGTSGPENLYGIQSCRWVATTTQKVSGFPDGWYDSIEVTVFDKDRETWARDQARGDPMTGFLDGALFAENYGEVWFTAHDRFCMVKARTNSAATRQQTTRNLAEQVARRVR